MTKSIISAKCLPAKVFSSKGIGAAVMLLALSLAVAVPVLSQPQGQGINCATDRKPDEIAVCSSSLLLQLDRQLNGTFASLRERLDGNNQIIFRDSQREWMQQRAACGGDTNCIYRRYQEGIQQLNAAVATTRPPDAGTSSTITVAQPRPPTKPETAVTATTSSADGTVLRRVALVLGNSAYRGQPVLANPRRDAAAIADALRQAGFQTVELATDLDRVSMVKALRVFRLQADRADWALVYFAGHGIELDDHNYLIPVDATLDDDRDVKNEAISYETLMDATGNARALRMIILDACRNNPFKDRMRRLLGMRSTVERGLRPPPEPEAGQMIVYSAAAGQLAADDADGENSPFARAFIKRMKEGPGSAQPVRVRPRRRSGGHRPLPEAVHHPVPVRWEPVLLRRGEVGGV
jgi:uncharacterized protein